MRNSITQVFIKKEKSKKDILVLRELYSYGFSVLNTAIYKG